MNWKWFAATRRERQLEELVGLLKADIANLEKRPAYIEVAVPSTNDQLAYWQALAKIEDDQLLRYHFAQMRNGIVSAFLVQGEKYSEFFRGKLSAIDEIVTDARNAKRRAMQIPVIEAENAL